ncbi:MAG: NAD regulator [Alphaproteobacteria bacterium]|nr:NAD regulator [Alphaproteobacteria bacterium]
MPQSFSKPAPASVAIALNAVLAAVENESPKVLCVKSEDGRLGLPYGPFNPALHRTFEIGLRDWVEQQAHVSLGYIEQLYTFGDKGREAPAAALKGGAADDRVVSVGYLALAPEAARVNAEEAGWRDWYEFFPWEDWRNGPPAILEDEILPALGKWTSARDESARRARVGLAFGLEDAGWEEERALDRYELMYEAGLVVEAARDRGARGSPLTAKTGESMISDHRRILATAIGRLRGKLKYRPIIFELMPPLFTLLALQRTVEAIVGFRLHKQNFRRSVAQSGLVVRTKGSAVQETGGRPAALFRVNREALKDRAAKGLAIPRMKRASDSGGPAAAKQG